METAPQQTWKPVTAGILNIISGVLNGLSLIWIFIAFSMMGGWEFLYDYIPYEDIVLILPLINTLVVVILIFEIINTILPIVGGIFALQRKHWVWALVGSVAAIMSAFVLGIFSTIFVSLSKDEFE